MSPEQNPSSNAHSSGSRSESESDSGPSDGERSDSPPSRENDGLSEGEQPEIDEGRYIYCLVSVPGGDDDSNVDFETTGVEGEPVSVVTVDGIGAVVHECDEIYDSADFSRIRRWLVRHQSVVDDAGQAFGTPLPFQFDTILRGDDDGVREWIRSEFETLETVLDSLADHWEYRVEVVRTDPIDDSTLAELDDELASLRERIDEAGDGAGFLLEKQYESRAKEVRANKRAVLADDLRDRLSEHAREVHELERTPTATLGDDAGDGDDDKETLCRLTLLAHEDEESAVGSVLDDVAAEQGIEVRFTGPWPPYTFAPELGDSSGRDSGGASGGDADAPADRDGLGERTVAENSTGTEDNHTSNPHSTHDR
ncbi:GvpL/GvpF family gas vesicle protein [Halobacteria archaeon AArc-m2/3/4]|uniref:GvpL/GvpF family gas vesicle protein n=1 Tax=Natronoglomus mannanivorans TaxID=2979990 RepID=A0ABT2QDZ5_9EURY|nr:GvpL/GvpF family gas vesicle protein [Halobacteria archaeon AArc-m2/3/4]